MQTFPHSNFYLTFPGVEKSEIQFFKYSKLFDMPNKQIKKLY